MQAAKGRDEKFCDPARQTSKEDLKHGWACGKNTNKVRWQPWQRHQNAWQLFMNVKVWEHSSFVRVSAPIDGGQCGRHEELAKSVGRVAVSGCMGYCRFAHDSQLLECPEEVASSSSSSLKSRPSPRRWWFQNVTRKMAVPSPLKKVSIMWRTPRCVPEKSVFAEGFQM